MGYATNLRIRIPRFWGFECKRCGDTILIREQPPTHSVDKYSCSSCRATKRYTGKEAIMADPTVYTVV